MKKQQNRKYIGAHVSVSGGVAEAPLRAHEIGAKAFGMFLGHSNRWKNKPLTDKEIELFRNRCQEFGFQPENILAHVNYLINLGSPEAETLEKSRESFLSEMTRCQQLGIRLLNFHPGSHKNLVSEDDCLKTIAESMNLALDATKDVTAVLETTAGQGTNLGFRFEHLARIIELVEDKERVGVCLDTCHSYSAGYDLRNAEGYEDTWRQFDEIIGPQFLKGMHLNDDKKPLGSRIDRHELLGKGTLGEEFFRRVVNDPRFNDIPIILETPDESIWPQEIKWLYSLIETPEK